jgi:crotonobetainyl-CoA:carnitine CoA-transferase CaiB-like acyl-CoA transferase
MPDPRPLAGVKILDLTQVVSGPVATMLLADFGADVIKIEPPAGEPYRNFGHPVEGPGGATNLNITRWSRGKRSVCLDLKSDEGRAALARLVEDADVLVENFRPGVLARLGFDRERLRELNPQLIYASISGYGHDDLFPSPYAKWPAYAVLTEAMGGLMHLAGEEDRPPAWMGFAMSDIFAGVLAVCGVVVALRERERNGEARRVDIAMHDGALFMNDLSIAAYSMLDEVMGRGGYSLQAPWSAYPAQDGYVAIAVLTAVEWEALCSVIGRPDLAAHEDLATGRGRALKERDVLQPAIGAWTGRLDKQSAAEALIAAGVPAAPVRTAQDVFDCPQTAAREMLVEAEDPALGTVKVVGNPIKIEGFTEPQATRIPALGEHTESVLASLSNADPVRPR